MELTKPIYFALPHFFSSPLRSRWLTFGFQASHAGGETIRIATFLQRLLGAGAVVWFYLYKALLPLNLVFVYPQWSIDPHDFVWWLPSFGVLVVTAGLGWQRHTAWGRPLLFAWAFFCISIFS